jgi:signal transduction histidine kinase
VSRIRIAVLVLAVVLLGGIGLLVERAFDLESDSRFDRHQRLAERVFDEMDDRLNFLLNAEDSRSFHQYRFLYVPEGAVSNERAWIRSELSQAPSADYIVGWFQYDSEGRFRSPLRPGVDERAILPTRWHASEQMQETEDELRRLTASLTQLPGFPQPSPKIVAIAAVDRKEAGSGGRPAKQNRDPFDPSPTSVYKVEEQAPSGPRRDVFRPPAKDQSFQRVLPISTEEVERPTTLASRLESKPTGKKRRKDEARKSVSSSLNKAAARRSSRAPRQATTKAANVYGIQQQASSLVDALEPAALRSAREGEPNASAPATGAASGDSYLSRTRGPQSAEEAIAQLWDDEDRAPIRDTVRSRLDELEEETLEAEVLDEELYDDPDWTIWVMTQRDVLIEGAAQGKQRTRVLHPAAGERLQIATAEEATDLDEAGLQRAAFQVDGLHLDADEDMQTVPVGDITVSPDLPSAERRRARAAVDELGALPGVAEPSRLAGADVPRSRNDLLPPDQGRVEAGPAELAPPPMSPDFAADQDLDVTISQLQGLPVAKDRLVLYRRVSVGPRIFFQGVVLRLPELVRDLEREVIAGTDLAGYLSFVWGPSSGDPAGADYAFDHVFAAPFEAVRATALFEEVPREGSDPLPFLLGLTLLLVGATLVGLLLLYRMVAVVVRFAEQRNNFVSAVSHELKTPLTAIRMYAEMLRDGIVSSDEKRQEYYRTITAESERLSRLINNVLELAKLEQGTRSVSFSVGRLRPVLEEAVLVLGPHARSRGFTFELVADDDLPPVCFEHDALLQVLINLVDNALKFSRTADDKRVVLEAKADPAGGVTIRVRDRGPGVPQAQLGRIFQPFFRGERELTRTTNGTGIGLALVQGLIECMGGRVTARNHPSGGFEVEIGLAPAPA